jgi:hypothetical protein
MKDNKLYIVIIFSLVIFGLILIGNSYVDLRNNKVQFSKNRPCTDCNENQYRIIPSIESDNVSVNLTGELISYDKNLCDIKKILHPDSMYLIFRYPLSYCGDCVNEIYTRLEQFKDSIPCIHTIIITSGGTIREMKVKMHPYKDIFPVYLMPVNDFGLPIDKSNVPYLVFVNDAMTSKHTLIIGPNSSDLLQKYIQILSKKYC